VSEGVGGPLLRWSAAHAQWAPPLVGTLLTTIIILQLVNLVNETGMASRRNMLPVILFPLLLALSGSEHILGAELLGMPLVLLAIARLWSAAADRHGLDGLFATGMLAGMASLLYLPYVFLLLAIWTTTAVFRPFGWRDHLVPLLGLLMVRWLAWGLGWIMDIQLLTPLGRTIAVSASDATGHRVFIVLFWSVLAMLTTLAFAGFVSGYRRIVMHGKNILSALLAFVILCALLAVFGQITGKGSPVVFIAGPATVLLCLPFAEARRRWIPATAWYLLLVLAVWAQWGGGLSSQA
jgi:hypothetical protein